MPRMWFVGYNGHGQFGRGPAFVQKRLYELPILGAAPTNPSHMSCTWSYNAIVSESHLLLIGSINKQFNKLETIIFDKPLRKVTTNDKAALVLLENGDMIKICPHTLSKSKLNIILEHNTATDTKPKQRQVPKFADDLPLNKPFRPIREVVTDIVSCDTFSVALTNHNALYTIPLKIHEFPKHERIVKMCGGAEHVLLLTANGDVYAFGSSSRGQLGLGSTNTEEKPKLIEALAGVKIVDIACGSWHSAAVSAFGDLYVWGWNANGQLGRPVYKESTVRYSNGRTQQIMHKVASVFAVPEVVNLPKGIPSTTLVCEDHLEDQFEVIRVACGARHTVVQTKCNQFLACGWNQYGQCGIGVQGTMDVTHFTKVVQLSPAIKNVLCGSWCTVFGK